MKWLFLSILVLCSIGLFLVPGLASSYPMGADVYSELATAQEAAIYGIHLDSQLMGCIP